jgi:hypothetical protein
MHIVLTQSLAYSLMRKKKLMNAKHEFHMANVH